MELPFVRTSRVRLNIRLPEVASKGRLLNTDDCYRWIKERTRLVGWTYNYNPFCPLIDSFERLISSQGRARSTVRIANNIHIKCYIGKYSMLIGSFNLTHPTVNDVCIEVKDLSLVNHMRKTFDQHWKLLE